MRNVIGKLTYAIGYSTGYMRVLGRKAGNVVRRMINRWNGS